MKLHEQIKHLPETMPRHWDSKVASDAYKVGHMHALRAAAEMALKSDACIDALRLIIRWVEAAALERDSLNWDVINNDEGQSAREALAAMDGRVLVTPNVRANRHFGVGWVWARLLKPKLSPPQSVRLSDQLGRTRLAD